MVNGLQPILWTPGAGRGWCGEPGRAARQGAEPTLLLIDREAGSVRRQLPALLQLLSEEEQGRWQRYRRAEDRERFLLGRGGLRLALGAVLQRDPTSLRFTAGDHGKPLLKGEGWAALAPQFNLSHSGRYVLLGLHWGGALGVDLEQVRADLPWAPIAERWLAGQVQNSISRLPLEEQALAFYRHWCRLEAELKARGVGLFGAEGRGGRWGVERHSGAACGWDLCLQPGYVGAVVCLPQASP